MLEKTRGGGEGILDVLQACTQRGELVVEPHLTVFPK